MLFNVLKIVVAYSVPTIIGVVFLSWMEKGERKFLGGEKLALGFLLGSGFVSFYMFYLGVLGIRFNFWTASVIIWPFFIWGILIWRKHGSKRLICFLRPVIFLERNRRQKFLIILLSALLLWKIFFIIFNILSGPTYFDDSVANYNYKAKIFYYSQSLVLNEEHPDFFGGYMPWKATGVSLFKTWMAIFLGKWSECGVNLNTLFFFLALGAISYYNLKRFLPRLISLIFTYILLSVPLLTFHAGFAYVDMIMGCYFFSGIVYLVRWMRENDLTSFFLSSLLFSAGLSTKDEMLALFIGGVLPGLILYQLVSRMKLKKIILITISYLAPIIILNLPRFEIKRAYNLAFGVPAEYRTFEFHPEALKILASYLFDSGNFNITWTVFFCALIFSGLLIIRTELKYILISLIGAFAVTLALFVFTSVFAWLQSGMTINRALLTFLPVAILYLAVFYGKVMKERESSVL